MALVCSAATNICRPMAPRLVHIRSRRSVAYCTACLERHASTFASCIVLRNAEDFGRKIFRWRKSFHCQIFRLAIDSHDALPFHLHSQRTDAPCCIAFNVTSAMYVFSSFLLFFFMWHLSLAHISVDSDVEYAPHHVVRFLKFSHHFVLDDAIRLCEQHRLSRALVHLYKRVGEWGRAIELLIPDASADESADPEEHISKALRLIEECSADEPSSSASVPTATTTTTAATVGTNDSPSDERLQLFNTLVDLLLNRRPNWLSTLLTFVGRSSMPWFALVSRLPGHLTLDSPHLPQLRALLQSLIADFRRQSTVASTAVSILTEDSGASLVRLLKRMRSGVRLPAGTRCSCCSQPLAQGQIIIFYCCHAFHAACLQGQLHCTQCRH